MQVIPLTENIGARIDGLDLERPLTEVHLALMIEALEKHKVLVFPNQINVGPEELLAFSARFTTPDTSPHRGRVHKDIIPGVRMVITDGKGFRSQYGVEDSWHNDASALSETRWFSILQAEEVPPHGRDTVFADMEAAYDRLSPEIQKLLEGLTAEYSWGRQDPEAPPVEHPVILQDEKSGRKCLYVNKAYTRSIVGLTPAESDWILAFLFEQTHYPECQVRISWSKGTIVVWDDQRTQHCLVQDRIGRRVMHRVEGLGLKSLDERQVLMAEV